MSLSLSQRPSGNPENPTRQQLDELDALLQRMLELPVAQPDAAADATPRPAVPPLSYTTTDEADEPSTDEPLPPKIDFQALKQRLAAQADVAPDAPATVGAETEPTAEDENWVPLSSTWQPSSLTWKPLARSLQQPATAAETVAKELPVWEPAAMSAPAAADAVTAFREWAEVRNPLAAADTSAGPPVAKWAAPLVWVNELFDRGLAPLGGVGRFLRTRSGRLFLAVVGAACLVAAAVVLFVDWIGWTS